jgi:hypothetical protein
MQQWTDHLGISNPVYSAGAFRVGAAATADMLFSVFFKNLVLEKPSEKIGYKKC